MIEPLYHQTVVGKKTMTRRSGGLDAVNDTSQEMAGHVRSPDDWLKVKNYLVENQQGEIIFNQGFKSTRANGDPSTEPITWCKARYRVGEVLYLKEPYFKVNKILSLNGYAYKFGAPEGDSINSTGHIIKTAGGTKFKNKLFMPADAARAYIRITGIKCERLLDISDEDCISEGIEQTANKTFKVYGKSWMRTTNDKKLSFLSLYKFANKMKPAAEIPNLWVFVYTFEYLPNYKP